MRDGSFVEELDPSSNNGGASEQCYYGRSGGSIHMKLKRLSKSTEPYVLGAIILLSLLIQFRSGQFFTGK